MLPSVSFATRITSITVRHRTHPLILLIAACLLTFAVSAQEPGGLVDLPITSYPTGLPIRVNGQPYTTPAIVRVDPTKPFVAEADERIEITPGTLYLVSTWRTYKPAEHLEETFSEPRISLANTISIGEIYLAASTYYRLTLIAAGPGQIGTNIFSEVEGYVSRGNYVILNAQPDPGALFLRWEGAVSSYAPEIRTFIEYPTTITARFVVAPPPANLTVTGSFATLQYRSSQDVLESSVHITSDRIFAPSEFGARAECNTSAAIANAYTVGSLAPFDIKIGIIPYWADRTPDGLYQCTASLYRPDLGPPLAIPFFVRLGPVPPEPSSTRVNAAVDGASYRDLALAPGSIFSIFGDLLSGETVQAEGLPLPSELGATQLRLTVGSQNRLAPLFYVSPTQINFLVPFDLPFGGGSLEVLRNGLSSPPFPITLEPLAPALFTANADGKGVPAGYYIRVFGEAQVRGELYTCPEEQPCVPLPLESPDPNEDVFLILFGTGFRNFTGTKPEVNIGSTLAEVTFVGPHPDFAGLDQINIKIPRLLLGTGLQTLTIKHLDKLANEVTVHF